VDEDLAFARAHQFQQLWRYQTAGLALPSAGRAIEEKACRHLQHFADLLNTASADAVGALFVFLDLLERYADLAEEFLRHVDLDAAHPDTASDIYVDGIGRLCRH